jgi:hypothetical protein
MEVNPLKLKFVKITVKNSVHTAKKTQPITITKINQLRLFKERIAFYFDNYNRSRGSSVGIVSDYGLDDRCSIPDRSRGFFF